MRPSQSRSQTQNANDKYVANKLYNGVGAVLEHRFAKRQCISAPKLRFFLGSDLGVQSCKFLIGMGVSCPEGSLKDFRYVSSYGVPEKWIHIKEACRHALFLGLVLKSSPMLVSWNVQLHDQPTRLVQYYLVQGPQPCSHSGASMGTNVHKVINSISPYVHTPFLYRRRC